MSLSVNRPAIVRGVINLFGRGRWRCGVCGRAARRADMIVAASRIGPVSHGHCSRCVERGAEPIAMFEGAFALLHAGRDGALGFSDDARRYVDTCARLTTWSDGHYMTWPEWLDTADGETLFRRAADGLADGASPAWADLSHGERQRWHRLAADTRAVAAAGAGRLS